MGQNHSIGERVSRWRIDPCRPEDLPRVAVLEAEAVGGGRPLSLLEQEMAREFAHIEVLWCDRQLLGFTNYWIVSDEVQLLTIATDLRFRRRGIARALLQKLIDNARAAGHARVMLELRTSNDPARKLYGAAGFTSLGIRRKYYQDGEDAEVLVLDLGDVREAPRG